MNLTQVIGPAVVAAIVSGIVSFLGLLITTKTSRVLHSEKLAFDREQTERKLAADIELASRKVELDRSLADWKRRMELAEQTLSDFYRARHIFRAARSPLVMAGEGASRRNGDELPSETEDQKRHRDATFAPLERLNRERDFLADLNSRRYRFSAVFGTESEKAFSALVSAYNQVAAATEMLLSEPPDALSNESTREFRRVIGWGHSKDDQVAREIDDAVTIIEAVCRPVLAFKP